MQIQATLRSLTASDVFNWRHICKCMSKTLHDTMYGGTRYSNVVRNAIHVVLKAPVAVSAQGIGDAPHPPTTSLVFVKRLAKNDEETLLFIGQPKPPQWHANVSVIYDGWGLKGDPFDLRGGECR